MANIRIQPETLRSKANELLNYKCTHDDNMSHVTSLVNGLTDIWEGQALTAFQAAFQEMQPTITNFSNMLEELAKKMQDAATAMENTDTEVAGRMG